MPIAIQQTLAITALALGGTQTDPRIASVALGPHVRSTETEPADFASAVHQASAAGGKDGDRAPVRAGPMGVITIIDPQRDSAGRTDAAERSLALTRSHHSADARALLAGPKHLDRQLFDDPFSGEQTELSPDSYGEQRRGAYVLDLEDDATTSLVNPISRDPKATDLLAMGGSPDEEARERAEEGDERKCEADEHTYEQSASIALRLVGIALWTVANTVIALTNAALWGVRAGWWIAGVCAVAIIGWGIHWSCLVLQG